MHTCKTQLESVTPYGQSKYIGLKPGPKETAADFEKRMWRERMHYDENGMVYIPPMAFKNCLSEAAKYLSLSIPGKGKVADPGLVGVAPGSGEIMMAPVSVCHHVSTMGQREPPTVS